MEMTLDKARSIILTAQEEHGEDPPVYEGDMPEDDDQIIADAEELYELASQAREDGFDGEAITAVLFAAEVDGGTDSDPHSDDDDDPDPEPDDEPMAPPWRGYDTRKVEQIMRKIPKLDDEELEYLYDYESANKGRKSILKELEALAEARAPEPEPEEEPAADDPEPDPEPDPQESAEPAETQDDDGYDPEHHKMIQKVTKRVDEEHFSVPKKLPKETTELPFDLTKESDTEIRRLHSAFGSYYARAAYVAKLEGQLADACKNVADKKMNEVLSSTSKIDPETKKEKNVTLLKAEAESDPEVALWRDREHTHAALSNNSKKDCDIYEKNIAVLSREWTMRHEEMEHSGSLNRRKK